MSAVLALALVIGTGLLNAQQPPADETKRDLKFTKSPAEWRPPCPVRWRFHAATPWWWAFRRQESAAARPVEVPFAGCGGDYTALISPEGGQFPPENVHRLFGPQATLQNLRHELEEWLPGISKDDDRVLIYFAGHGFVSSGKAYFAPYDMDPANIPGSSYSMDQLGRVIGGKIKAKWKVLLTDACHSGAITPEADTLQINSRLLHLDRSLFSLTASRYRELSFESGTWGGGHGVFSYFLKKGIEGEADENGDGVVTADELAEYVGRTSGGRRTRARIPPASGAASIPRWYWRTTPAGRRRNRRSRRNSERW